MIQLTTINEKSVGLRKMKHSEKKFINSQEKMIKAMIKLLHESDFLSISVQALCLTAKINRTTFYAHYDNLYELLEDTKNYLINSFLEQYKEKQSANKNADYIENEYLLPYLRFIKENNFLYRAFEKLSLNYDQDYFFNSLVQNISLPLAEKKDMSVDEKEIRYIAKFYVSGIAGIVHEWSKNNFQESEEYICDLILKLKHI